VFGVKPTIQRGMKNGRYIYPSPEWLEESFKLYGPEFEGKLKTLSGHFAFRIQTDPAFGIERDLYMCMVIDTGKLGRLALYSEEDAKKEADFILAATPPLCVEEDTAKAG